MKTEEKSINLTIIADLHSEGKQRKEILMTLIRDGIDIDEAEKLIKLSGIQFRRKKGNTWKDVSVELFTENQDATKDDMKEAITGSIKEGAEEYYVKNFYHIFKALANI